MKSILLASHKGGTGKSTLAINVAVYGQEQAKEVLLVDLDHNSATVAEWSSVRESDTPMVVTASFFDVNALLKQAKDEGFDLVILDAPAYLSEEIAELTQLVDITLLPVSPTFAEITSLPKNLSKINSEYAVVLNNCETNDSDNISNKTLNIIDLLEDNEIPLIPVQINRSKLFDDAMRRGLATHEMSAENSSQIPIKALYESLLL